MKKHPPVALQFMQQKLDYQNHRSTNILTQIIKMLGR